MGRSFTIQARIQASEHGLFTAVVAAVPQHQDVLAEVRTHDCASHHEALALLDPMARGLGVELTARGDQVLDFQFQ
jgi:hypothetical protein